jgi:hypothetical protein
MRYDQNAHPRCLSLVAALATVLLFTPLTHAAPSPDSVSGDQNSAAQTALSIAAAAAMSGAASVATAPPAASVQPIVSKHSMTPEERQHFMMLLMLRETSRNPLGSLQRP